MMGVGSVLYFPEVMTNLLTFLNRKKVFESKLAYGISYITKDTRDLIISENSKTKDMIEDYMDEIRNSLEKIKNPEYRSASP